MRLKSILIAATVFLSLLAFRTSSYADLFSPYAHYNRINTDILEPGTIELKGELTFDSYFHKPGDGWIVYPDRSGLGKFMSYTPSNPATHNNKWTDTYGQTLLLNLGIKPTEWFFAEFGVEFLGDYADKFWMPINEEHRFKSLTSPFYHLNWNNARIGIKTDWIYLAYHKNYGHQGWVYEGDLFDMLPRQDNADNYLRYSGHHTPDYWQLKIKGFYGDLDVIYGEEVLQDYKKGIYVKYKNIFHSNINFFYSDHVIPYGFEDERMRNFQLNTDFTFLNTTLQVGALYRPFRLNKEYQYVEDVGIGNGLNGSKYEVKTDKTTEKDALGGSLQWQLRKKFLLDLINVGYEYRGLVAGNRQKVNASVEKSLTKYINTFLGYSYQKPLLSAMPLVYSGGGSGPVSISARGPESPFWVWWRNPITGFDNRETSALSFVFTYDPTPSTWFYNYMPNEPVEYNLNPEEDAPFSFAAKVNLAKYSGPLDRQQYWEYDGSTAWEDAYANGTNVPDRYIGSLYLLTQFIKNNTKILYDFEVGEDLATLSYPYSDTSGGSGRDPYTSSFIGYFKTSLKVDTKPYLFKVAYLKNFWGPEDWHRNFGATFDELYLAHISRDLGKWFNFGVEYVGGRKTNSALLSDPAFVDQELSNELGTFDEIRVFVKIYFDGVFKFGDRGEEGGMPFGVEFDKTAPQIALKAYPDTIYPADGGKASLEPWASDHSGIEKWSINIKDVNGNTVKHFDGEIETPEELKWDGRNERNGQICPDGEYFATLEGIDNYGNKDITEPAKIIVATRPKIANADVKETERGLVISLGAKVLFDSGKFALKSGATKTLQEVAVLLNKYPDNNIAIEGHTDWVGKVAYNQKLSEDRAKSVKNFLVKQGVAADRMQITGFGKLKPVADNNTAKGREQNRRVEIIVLNNAIVVDENQSKEVKDTVPNN
ncbi:OmpA family protein [Endomicrobium proavitum]|uniref:OmpA-like domain-containing protein n=1 Tax=Endomicrobium proavitum TaxID=1408281 RepID=A0A0G3WKL8_9BACT|nr:OmpA family protein [Endomicrobium proavitum]AKL97999.1 exported protein of unknown function [Endomicrobium proavitum]